MVTVGKGLFHGFGQQHAVKVKFICQIINIVIVLHSAGEFHQIEDCIDFFCDGRFKRVCIYRRSGKIFKLRRNLPLFILWNDNVTYTKINVERCFCVLDPSHEGCTDSCVFFRYSNRRNTFNFISHKIISSRSGNNFLQHSFQLLRCVWHFPEKKVYIHCHTTVKIGNGIDEQTALKYKIFSIFGFFQSAQKFLLAKKLQAKLIGSSAFVRFVFQSRQYRCRNIRH